MIKFTDFLKEKYNIKTKTIEIFSQAEKEISGQFAKISEISAINQAKVLSAFNKFRVSTEHLGLTTGYGYDDVGRDTLDEIYAEVFGAEAALVRHNFVSGTHALSSCFFGVLRPGDTLMYVTGKPYDTLEEVIGIRGEKDSGSLYDFGVKYKEVALKSDGSPDFDAIKNAIDDSVKMVVMQRSKGYEWRKSMFVDDIGEIVKCVKSVNSRIICMVDNCYGEFVETKEPTEVGADIIAGSLIKNPGGGLALSGGYVAGRRDLVEKISYRLTSPGIGAEVGASLGNNRNMYQGLFMAPHIVGESIKTAVLAAKMLELAGFEVCPSSSDERTDIIQAVKLCSEERLCAFCRGIQAGSPIDSHVSPVPWDMPGYENQVIMAAGTFVAGASIEISADAPIKEPFVGYLQGGLTYESGKIAVIKAIDNIICA